MPFDTKNARDPAFAIPVDGLEERLSDDLRNRRAGIAAQLMEIGRNCAAAAPDEWLKRNFVEDLYEEHGMPDEVPRNG